MVFCFILKKKLYFIKNLQDNLVLVFLHVFCLNEINSHNCFIHWKLSGFRCAKHVLIISDFWKTSKLYPPNAISKTLKTENENWKLKNESWKWKLVFENDFKHLQKHSHGSHSWSISSFSNKLIFFRSPLTTITKYAIWYSELIIQTFTQRHSTTSSTFVDCQTRIIKQLYPQYHLRSMMFDTPNNPQYAN